MAHVAQTEDTPGAYSSDQQGLECCWAPRYISYVRKLSQDQETKPTLSILINRIKHIKLGKIEGGEKRVPNELAVKSSRKMNKVKQVIYPPKNF